MVGTDNGEPAIDAEQRRIRVTVADTRRFALPSSRRIEVRRPRRCAPLRPGLAGGLRRPRRSRRALRSTGPSVERSASRQSAAVQPACAAACWVLQHAPLDGSRPLDPRVADVDEQHQSRRCISLLRGAQAHVAGVEALDAIRDGPQRAARRLASTPSALPSIPLSVLMTLTRTRPPASASKATQSPCSEGCESRVLELGQRCKHTPRPDASRLRKRIACSRHAPGIDFAEIGRGQQARSLERRARSRRQRDVQPQPRVNERWHHRRSRSASATAARRA